MYDLDGGGVDRQIHLNYNLNPLRLEGDATLLLPVSLFGNAASSTYVYLYSAFGAGGGGLVSSDGFEEWFIQVNSNPTTGVPVPAASGPD